MKPATREWVDRAEADYAAALLLRRSRKKHSRDLVCYHLQQCIEKYLKARLVEGGIAVPKTHDLERLLDLAVKLEPLWETMRPAAAALTDYAVEVRYPGRTTTPDEARALLRSTNRMRENIRECLELT
jgi:HEPN domain-containing protein